MIDIFDLEDVDDLPWLLKKEVDLPYTRIQQPHTRDMIKQLFSTKEKLTHNEIMVGIFRQFGLWRKNREISHALDMLGYMGEIEEKKAQHLFVSTKRHEV